MITDASQMTLARAWATTCRRCHEALLPLFPKSIFYVILYGFRGSFHRFWNFEFIVALKHVQNSERDGRCGTCSTNGPVSPARLYKARGPGSHCPGETSLTTDTETSPVCSTVLSHMGCKNLMKPHTHNDGRCGYGSPLANCFNKEYFFLIMPDCIDYTLYN